MDIDQIMQDNMGLVYHQLHRFGLAYDPDAFSYAQEALWHAIETYNDTKKVKLSTYASVCIHNALGCYLRRLSSQKEVFYTTCVDRVSDNYELDVASYLAVNQVADPQAALEQRELYRRLQDALRKVLAEQHSAAAARAVSIWWDSQCTLSQAAIAAEAGLSQGQVSRILSIAKHKLKQELEDYLC